MPLKSKMGVLHILLNLKKMCVEAVLPGDGSVDDIVEKYSISSRKVLRNWILIYNANKGLKEILENTGFSRVLIIFL